MKIILVGVFLAVTLSLVAFWGLKSWEDGFSAHGADLNKTDLGKIELVTVEGKKTTVADLPGDVRVLNFWATWCAPCIDEMPSLLALQRMMRSKGLRIYGINQDENPKDVLKPFLTKYQIDFENYLDASNEISDRFQIEVFPTTLFLDKNNAIILTKKGQWDWTSKRMLVEIESLLK